MGLIGVLYLEVFLSGKSSERNKKMFKQMIFQKQRGFKYGLLQ
jgi:hypothetical protein